VDGMVRRGRPNIMRDRVPIVVNVEREHLEELKKRNVTVAKIVRDGIQKTLETYPPDVLEFKLGLEKDEMDFIEEYKKVLNLEYKLTVLKESGQCSEEDFKKMKDDIERMKTTSEKNINDVREMLKNDLFKHTQIKPNTCIYGRSKNVPLNSKNGSTVFHHMHLDLYGGTHRNIGIYIPKELHRSIKHSSISGEGMKDINKASLLWLCEQDTI